MARWSGISFVPAESAQGRFGGFVAVPAFKRQLPACALIASTRLWIRSWVPHGKRLHQIRDGCGAVLEQVHRQDVAELDSPHAPRAVHGQTMACRTDIDVLSLEGGQPRHPLPRANHAILSQEPTTPSSPKSNASAPGT